MPSSPAMWSLVPPPVGAIPVGEGAGVGGLGGTSAVPEVPPPVGGLAACCWASEMSGPICCMKTRRSWDSVCWAPLRV